MAVLGSTSLTGCNAIPDFIAAGSLMLFQQSSAPTGWLKETTHNNKALRVVTGAASSGGSTAFTSVFASRTPAGSVSVSSSGTVGDTTLTTAQIPSHNHTFEYAPGVVTRSEGGNGNSIFSNPFTGTTSSTGGGGSHTHSFTASSSGSFTGTAMDFAVQYVDLIICSKDP